ncbi:hypothetical protein BDP27DRAFT_1508916 [Rhodocollybia butyracea]|uniref:Uncharacterized protein n=1 Tax=Rhodocollybia butyracea TaxID=206335 RepID=A0A9P5P7T1_9AGAR|nr:hypothetical protein BDP27DRAFT_1508916 [Rhodocollybia butyracea]
MLEDISLACTWYVAVAGALSVYFPSGTIEALKPLNITWEHAKHTSASWVLEKTKLDQPGGPGPTVLVPIVNSTSGEGYFPSTLTRQVAVNAWHEPDVTLFKTVATVISPTSSSVAAPRFTMAKSTSSSTSATKNHKAVVAGGIAGGIIGLVLLSITLILYWRRSRHKKASLRIPYPFYDESDGGAHGVLVSRGINPTEFRAQMPPHGGVREAFPRVATSRIEEKRLAASRPANGAYNGSKEM